MEGQQSWKPKLSFRNATMVLCLVNLVSALFLLQGFISSASSRSKSPSSQYTSAQLRYMKESEEIRLAMQPWELIKRVKEIQQEVYTEPEMVKVMDTKQTAAADISKRLQDLRSLNDPNSMKALEEWRKRKMERARLRQRGKNGTSTSATQA